MNGRKGDWVRIHSTILAPEDRSQRLPEDTRQVPVEMWVKGLLLADAKVGEKVEVETATGRFVSGRLIDTTPFWGHGFGDFVPELELVGRQLKAAMKAVNKSGDES